MNCAQVRNDLEAFVDGEQDLARHLEIEQHLAECPACAEAHERLRALSAALKTDGLHYRAPSGLRDRVRASLRRAPGPETVRPRRSIRWRRIYIGMAVAASVALLLGGLSLIAWNLLQPRSAVEDQLAREVVTNHIRSLQVDHLTDVSSSDRHTVKPWFKGKVDFSPTVCDLAGEGYPLVGGRLEYLDNRPVVALVYQRRLHVINLYLWPTTATERGPTMLARNGYNVVQWTAGGMTWWAVSDLNAEELRQFADMVAKEARPAHL